MFPVVCSAQFLPYFRAKGVVGKGNYSLSLICLHIFLLFSVCTRRPSFFVNSYSTLQENRSDELFLHESSDIEMLTYAKYAALSLPCFAQK